MLVSKISGSTGDIVGFKLLNNKEIVGILSGKTSNTFDILNPMVLIEGDLLPNSLVSFLISANECTFRIDAVTTMPSKVTQEIAKLFLDTVSPKEV